MTREIQAQHVTGATLYAVLLDVSGQPWNGSAFDATPTAGEWANYDIAMTEDSTMGYYVGTFPASQAAGLYSYRVHKQLGGTPAATDPVVWTGEGYWSGTAWASPPTAAVIADAVHDEQLSGHQTAGSAGKALSDAGAAGDPWEVDLDAGSYADGTAGATLLSLEGGTVYATGSTPNTDAALTIRRGDTVPVTIGDLTDLVSGWDSLWVTIKSSQEHTDAESILQVRLNAATPTLPGLLYVNGQTVAVAGVAATDAWISDVNTVAKTLKLNLKPAMSLLLPARGSLWWDVQMEKDGDITTLATGDKSAEITADITRAVA